MTPTTNLPPFPKVIEYWWWNQALMKWPDYTEEKLLNSIRREIVEQSDRFNKTRRSTEFLWLEGFVPCLLWQLLFSPYLASNGFCPVGGLLFQKLESSPQRTAAHLDLGSGSGASGLASLFLLRKWGLTNPMTLEAWDYSGKSLAMMKNLHRTCLELWPDSKVFTTRKDLTNDVSPSQARKFDLILIGYSLNEIHQETDCGSRSDWLKQVLKHLKQGGFLIIMDPAGSDTCLNLQAVSHVLTQGNSKIKSHAPYFNGLPCPFFIQKSKFYSHEVRNIIPTETVQKINAPLHLETNEVKFGLSMLSKAEVPSLKLGPERCRLVSPVRKRKGTISFFGIGSDGKAYRYELQRRDIKKDETKSILTLQRGDLLHIQYIAPGKDESQVRLPSYRAIAPLFIPRIGNR